MAFGTLKKTAEYMAPEALSPKRQRLMESPLLGKIAECRRRGLSDSLAGRCRRELCGDSVWHRLRWVRISGQAARTSLSKAKWNPPSIKTNLRRLLLRWTPLSGPLEAGLKVEAAPF
jgi:hypothetical protein